MEAREVLLALVEKYQGDWDKVFKAIQDKEDINDGSGQKYYNDMMSKCAAEGVKVTTIVDDDYPEAFKQMVNPPFAVFYKGDIGLVSKGDSGRVYVTGAGDTLSDFGKRATVKVALDLKGESKSVIMTTTDDSAPEIAAQKAMRLVSPDAKRAIICSGALDHPKSADAKVIADNIVLAGGIAMSVIPVGCSGHGAPTPMAAVLCGGNVIVTELGAMSAQDFMKQTWLAKYARRCYAVVHDITEATVDGCNALLMDTRFSPYLGVAKFN